MKIWDSQKIRKRKPTKPQLRAREEHEAWIRNMGIKKPDKSISVVELPNLREGIRDNAKLSNNIDASGPKRRQNTYTGDYILGIATMHKSNLVPITSKESAEDVSKMRRN